MLKQMALHNILGGMMMDNNNQNENNTFLQNAVNNTQPVGQGGETGYEYRHWVSIDDTKAEFSDNKTESEGQKIKEAKTPKNGKLVRKIMAIALSAAMFGFISGGIFLLMSKDAIKELNEAKTPVVADTESIIEQIEDFEEDITSEATEASNTSDIKIPTTNTSTNGSGMDVSAIVEEAMPSVVSVNVTAVMEIDQGIFGSYEYEGQGSGSGIIIDKNENELLIVTNNHVVQNAKTVQVGFIDGQYYDALVKGTDEANDLAIIVVSLKDISSETLGSIKLAVLGDSNEVLVGEQVVAIGNALGYGQSVTTGIVSAKDRTNDTNDTPLIQTDAAINPGNSGGALLNMKGEVIGINSSKYASTEVEGMGYAIPVSSVSEIINDLMNQKTREKVAEEDSGYLGIECSDVTYEMIYYYGAPEGIYVAGVTEGLAADKAGIPKGAIITKLDVKNISSITELKDALLYYRAGEKVDVVYYVMENNEYVEKTTSVVLGRRPKENQ